MFFPVKEVSDEFERILAGTVDFDVATIVGEGEPTLYLGLGELISEIKKRTDKPVAVITNGALFYDPVLRSELYNADIVLPSLDAYDEAVFKRINRPYGTIKFADVMDGLTVFSHEYKGQLWIEIMLIDNINDDEEALKKYSELLRNINYDRLYLNTPVRPPAEENVKAVDHKKMSHAVDILGGISIDLLESLGFHSEETDDYAAILSIIKRHPMNQFEIEGFLKSRGCPTAEAVMNQLKDDEKVTSINYKGYHTFRLK